MQTLDRRLASWRCGKRLIKLGCRFFSIDRECRHPRLRRLTTISETPGRVGKGGPDASSDEQHVFRRAHAVGAIRVRKGGPCNVPTMRRLGRLCTPYKLLVFPRCRGAQKRSTYCCKSPNTETLRSADSTVGGCTIVAQREHDRTTTDRNRRRPPRPVIRRTARDGDLISVAVAAVGPSP